MTGTEFQLLKEWSDERHRESMARFDRVETLIERVDTRMNRRMNEFDARLRSVEQSTLDPEDVRKLRMVANAAAIVRLIADKRLWPILAIPAAGATVACITAAIKFVSAIAG